MTDSLKFSLKFKTPRKLIQSKLLYVDEELPRRFINLMSNAQFTLGPWGSLHVKEDKWKETEQYTSLIPQGTWKKNSLLENPF